MFWCIVIYFRICSYFRTNNFWKDMNSTMDLIVSLLFFYKDDFSVKRPSKVDIALMKKSKTLYIFVYILLDNLLAI